MDEEVETENSNETASKPKKSCKKGTRKTKSSKSQAYNLKLQNLYLYYTNKAFNFTLTIPTKSKNAFKSTRKLISNSSISGSYTHTLDQKSDYKLDLKLSYRSQKCIFDAKLVFKQYYGIHFYTDEVISLRQK